MKRAFQTIFRLLFPRQKQSRRHPRLNPAPQAGEWTSENAVELARFLGTQTGQTFLRRARAMEYNVAVQCVRDAAAGNIRVPTFSDAINWIESLSHAGGASPAPDGLSSGESILAEKQLALA